MISELRNSDSLVHFQSFNVSELSELRKYDSPVHHQRFNVSAIYLDRTAMIFRCSYRMVETLYFHYDQMTEIFSPLCFLLIVWMLIGRSRSLP
jgi:hypothetical protein